MRSRSRGNVGSVGAGNKTWTLGDRKVTVAYLSPQSMYMYSPRTQVLNCTHCVLGLRYGEVLPLSTCLPGHKTGAAGVVLHTQMVSVGLHV